MNIMKLISPSKIRLTGIPKDTLYHYTGSEKFKAIIGSKHFRLTHYSNLKGDPDEMSWAFRAYEEILKPVFPTIDFKSLGFAELYVFCTSIRENNRHLWSEYAEDKTGIVFGIDSSALYEIYNLNSFKIFVTSMDYNPDVFIKLCRESVAGLEPFNVTSFPEGSENMTREQKILWLEKDPTYAKFKSRRNSVGEVIALQKQKRFALEEETRIVHSVELEHTPLEIREFGGKRQAILPFALDNGHLIKEVIITPHCLMTPSEIRDFMNENQIEAPVRVIDAAALA